MIVSTAHHQVHACALRICVTGGAGFVGINLAGALVRAGHAVTVVDVGDRLGRLSASDIGSQCDVINEDLGRLSTIAGEFDVIVHLAALAHVDYSIAHPGQVLRNNLASTATALETARQTGTRILLASSVEVYGGNRPGVMTEQDPVNPLSPYAATKIAMEALADSYRRAYGIDVTVFRFTNMYGPWQAPDRVIPRVICQKMGGFSSSATVERWRDFMHVDDAVAALLHAIAGPLAAPIYNIAPTKQHSIVDVVRRIRNDAPQDVRLISGDEGRGYSLVTNSRLFTSETTWQAHSEFEDRIGELEDWYRSHAEWTSRFRSIVGAPQGSPDSLSDHVYTIEQETK